MKLDSGICTDLAAVEIYIDVAVRFLYIVRGEGHIARTDHIVADLVCVIDRVVAVLPADELPAGCRRNCREGRDYIAQLLTDGSLRSCRVGSADIAVVALCEGDLIGIRGPFRIERDIVDNCIGRAGRGDDSGAAACHVVEPAREGVTVSRCGRDRVDLVARLFAGNGLRASRTRADHAAVSVERYGDVVSLRPNGVVGRVGRRDSERIGSGRGFGRCPTLKLPAGARGLVSRRYGIAALAGHAVRGRTGGELTAVRVERELNIGCIVKDSVQRDVFVQHCELRAGVDGERAGAVRLVVPLDEALCGVAVRDGSHRRQLIALHKAVRAVRLDGSCAGTAVGVIGHLVEGVYNDLVNILPFVIDTRSGNMGIQIKSVGAVFRDLIFALIRVCSSVLFRRAAYICNLGAGRVVKLDLIHNVSLVVCVAVDKYRRFVLCLIRRHVGSRRGLADELAVRVGGDVILRVRTRGVDIGGDGGRIRRAERSVCIDVDRSLLIELLRLVVCAGVVRAFHAVLPDIELDYVVISE